ncbi:protein ABHD1 [Cydia splendana]|uniref:protein ABHD1 n=1 Tax=Cydia splendana TaxID=1100963 RepID=UPI00213AD3C4
MLGMFMYMLEARKELLVGLSLSVLYITYYLVEVVKRPLLVCGPGALRSLLERDVPLLQTPYWPTPWCVEARLQTVLGSILRSLLLPHARYRREVLRLADGGQVALDWLENSAGPGAPVLLVLPGLTGGSQADYVRALCAAARQLGAQAVVFHYRGLGGIKLTTPRLYCAVSHEDLAEVVEAVSERAGDAPVLAVGVSLGGLILGQYLAAAGDQARVHAALVVSSPLDVERGSECMERGLNALLSRHMARNLRRTVCSHSLVTAGSDEHARVEKATSVRAFDAAFTTGHFGFGSVEAYYRAATLTDKLGAVRVPLLCLCAADDPFQPLEVLPLAEVAASKSVALAVPARGGHIGFLEGWWPAGQDQYMARVAVQYFSALLRNPDLLHTPPKVQTQTEKIETGKKQEEVEKQEKVAC